MLTQIQSNVQSQTVHILLIEDDEVDKEAIVRGFQKQRICNPFTVVSNGIEALHVLRGTEGYERLPRPYLILLDINMPRMTGLEFLDQLRTDDALKYSIVFVLTTSNRDEDKVAAYKKQIAGYLLKSRAGEDFVNMISLLESYWRVVEFPPEVGS